MTTHMARLNNLPIFIRNHGGLRGWRRRRSWTTMLLASPISQTSVQIDATDVRDISTNWWGSPAEQSIPVGTSGMPCSDRESNGHHAWALEEAHRNPVCQEASDHCAANFAFDGLSPTLLFTVTDAASATDSSSMSTHACQR
jgi:hypothetical protein